MSIVRRATGTADHRESELDVRQPNATFPRIGLVGNSVNSGNRIVLKPRGSGFREDI